MPKLQCAILDDYQNVALQSADWSSLADEIDVTPHCEHFQNDEAVIAAAGQAEILVVMRERTPLGAALLSRLPNLRLLITTGMRNSSCWHSSRRFKTAPAANE